MTIRKAFKIFNIFILIYYGIVGVIALLNAFGATKNLTEYAPSMSAFAVILLLITLAPTALVIFMAREGLRENYELAYKIAMFVVFMDVVGLISSDQKSLGSVIALILGIVYVFMAKIIA